MTFTPEGIKVIEPGRLRRAIHLTAKRIDVDTYRVRGGTADHMVEVEDGRCYCDCIDAQVRGDTCKHSLLVRLLAGDEEVVKALRRIVPKTATKAPSPRPPILAKVP